MGRLFLNFKLLPRGALPLESSEAGFKVDVP
jgi:hypothetical protein